MAALKRNFPDYKVIQASEFLSKNDRFYYWDKYGSDWIARVAAADPSFRETRLGANTYGVERMH